MQELTQQPLPDLDTFLSSSRMLDPAEFPSKDTKKNQLFLAVDLKKYKPQELLFMKARLEGKNQSQAAIAAGYSEHSAAVMGSRKEKELAEDLQVMMNEKGMGLSALLDKLAQLLNAQTLKYHPGSKKMLRVADNSIQTQNLQTALKLQGVLRNDDQAQPTTINVILGTDVNGQAVDRSRAIAMPAAVVVDEGGPDPEQGSEDDAHS